MKPHLIGSIVLVSTFLVFSLSGFGADDDLPRNSKLLLERLSAFEEEERKNYDAIVAEKETQVVKVLKSHLARETKSGNLDGAIALRKLIQQLSKSLSKGPRQAKATPVIPPEAKRFRNSGYYIFLFKEGGLSYVEAAELAREKGGEVFAPKSQRDVEAMLEIVKNTRCWLGLKYDQNTKKFLPDGKAVEPFDLEDIGIENFDFNPDNIGHEVFLATNGSGGFKLGRKVPVVKNAVLGVIIFFEDRKP